MLGRPPLGAWPRESMLTHFSRGQRRPHRIMSRRGPSFLASSSSGSISRWSVIVGPEFPLHASDDFSARSRLGRQLPLDGWAEKIASARPPVEDGDNYGPLRAPSRGRSSPLEPSSSNSSSSHRLFRHSGRPSISFSISRVEFSHLALEPDTSCGARHVVSQPAPCGRPSLR